jgi:hypothetical protein
MEASCPSEVKKLQQLEEENTRLRKVVADLTRDEQMLAGGDPLQTTSPARGREVITLVRAAF